MSILVIIHIHSNFTKHLNTASAINNNFKNIVYQTLYMLITSAVSFSSTVYSASFISTAMPNWHFVFLERKGIGKEISKERKSYAMILIEEKIGKQVRVAK